MVLIYKFFVFNESIIAIIEENYSQGNKQPEISAFVSSFIDKVKDFFEIRPLEVSSLTTLSEGSNAVTEMIVKNNLDSSQQFDWIFNTGTENITSDNITTISTDDIFIYIESDYANEGVHKTIATINSSSYKDNQSGVVIS